MFLGSLFKKLWIDYDEKADVLYISFVYLSRAVEREEDEKGIIKTMMRMGILWG